MRQAHQPMIFQDYANLEDKIYHYVNFCQKSTFLDSMKGITDITKTSIGQENLNLLPLSHNIV